MEGSRGEIGGRREEGGVTEQESGEGHKDMINVSTLAPLNVHSCKPVGTSVTPPSSYSRQTPALAGGVITEGRDGAGGMAVTRLASQVTWWAERCQVRLWGRVDHQMIYWRLNTIERQTLPCSSSAHSLHHILFAAPHVDHTHSVTSRTVGHRAPGGMFHLAHTAHHCIESHNNTWCETGGAYYMCHHSYSSWGCRSWHTVSHLA